MRRKRKIRRKEGDVVSIPLGSNKLGFGWVLDEPLMAFFDFACDVDAAPPIEQIVERPIIFRIWVMNHAVTDGTWQVIGHVPVPGPAREPPWFFKQDPISCKLSITRNGSEEIEADRERCSGLERAAVWDPQHVVDRLNDHFSGQPNKWVESMRLRR